MPQMMPCSWLMVFMGSVSVFVLLGSNWSTFFFLSSFPKKESLSSSSSKKFWLK